MLQPLIIINNQWQLLSGNLHCDAIYFVVQMF